MIAFIDDERSRYDEFVNHNPDMDSDYFATPQEFINWCSNIHNLDKVTCVSLDHDFYDPYQNLFTIQPVIDYILNNQRDFIGKLIVIHSTNNAATANLLRQFSTTDFLIRVLPYSWEHWDLYSTLLNID